MEKKKTESPLSFIYLRKQGSPYSRAENLYKETLRVCQASWDPLQKADEQVSRDPIHEDPFPVAYTGKVLTPYPHSEYLQSVMCHASCWLLCGIEN